MNNETKINKLLQIIPDGTVILSSWLADKGYPYALQQRYRKGGWFTSIGKGAMVRNGQKLLLNGAVYALQHQAGIQIHIGGRSALNMLGLAHYLEIKSNMTTLFANYGVSLPSWMTKNNWDTHPELFINSIFPDEDGLMDFQEKDYIIKISGSTRAMMECLALTPDRFDLKEAAEIMEGLNLLNPLNVQNLLEKCKSVKVKRLFLFFAERAGHSWLNHLENNKINLGSGKRSIFPGGKYLSTYQTTLPPELIQ